MFRFEIITRFKKQKTKTEKSEKKSVLSSMNIKENIIDSERGAAAELIPTIQGPAAT